MSNLTVTDAAGRKYKPTGMFREPEHGEFLYCFDHKRVEQRHPQATGVHFWCSNAHVEFILHRIIVEPLPVEYEVTVRLDADDFRWYGTKEGDINWTPLGRVIHDAIRTGRYREVSRD